MRTNYITDNMSITNPSQIEKMYIQYFLNGVPHGIELGVDNLDACFRLDKGKLVVVTGIPNMGKSEFIDFMCVQYNKLYGMKTLYFSPENQPLPMHIDKLCKRFEGKKFDTSQLDDARAIEVRKYIYDNFFFVDYNKEYKIEQLALIIERLVYTSGVDILVIDSHNKLLHDLTKNETEVIGRELDMLERLAKRLNIIIILVAHPRKQMRNGNEYVIPSAYDINGSANFFNKADFVLVVHRNREPDYIIIKVEKVKFKNYGCQGEVHLGYDNVTGDYYSIPKMDDMFPKQDVPPPPIRKAFDLCTHIKSGDKWLDVQCGYSNRVHDMNTRNCNLWQFLTTTNSELQNSLSIIKQTTDKKERQDAKKRLLPIITPSVTLRGKRDTEHISGYTDIICIDIDKADNPDNMDKVLNILKSLPYVALAQRSASGEGYCAFIPIKSGYNHYEHFLALEKDFADMGITIDKACKDAVRARYYSYDEDRYVNPACSVYVKRLAAQSKERDKSNLTQQVVEPVYNMTTVSSGDWVSDLDKACLELDGYDVCPSYHAWVEVGSALAKELGENGRVYFHKLSKGYSQYDVAETDDKYSELMQHAHDYAYNKGTIFHYIKQAMQIA